MIKFANAEMTRHRFLEINDVAAQVTENTTLTYHHTNLLLGETCYHVLPVVYLYVLLK